MIIVNKQKEISVKLITLSEGVSELYLEQLYFQYNKPIFD